MNKDISFSRTAVIFSSRESLWKVLLTGKIYEMTWGATLKTTWEPGSDIQFSGTWEGVEYVDKGVIQINYEYELLQFSYWSSFWEVADTPEECCLITFKIHALDSMTCECTITQDGFRDEKHHAETVALLITTLNTIKVEAERHLLNSFCSGLFDKLIPLIESAEPEIYNKPVGGGWSAGQVAEHIIISCSDLTQFFQSANSSSIPYDKNVAGIRELMFDTTRKLKAPDALNPPFKMFDRKQHIERLRATSHEINDCIATFDFTRKCESYPMHPFGYVSIFEWLTFMVCHIARHTTQLEEMRTKATANNNQ